MTLFKLILSDYKKYKKYNANFFSIIFLTQGFWAILNYRVTNKLHNFKIPFLKQVLLLLCLIWKKIIELTTGISVSSKTVIGHSFYIGHFGNIIIHPAAILGNNCNISQGVTIGVSGRGENRGVPIIGDNNYIGANAVVVGKINIGNNCVIAANSLIIESLKDNSTAIGVPSKVINYKGSKDYI